MICSSIPFLCWCKSIQPFLPCYLWYLDQQCGQATSVFVMILNHQFFLKNVLHLHNPPLRLSLNLSPFQNLQVNKEKAFWEKLFQDTWIQHLHQWHLLLLHCFPILLHGLHCVHHPPLIAMNTLHQFHRQYLLGCTSFTTITRSKVQYCQESQWNL